MANESDSRLDRVLSHLDSLHAKMDESAEGNKQLAARIEALEKGREETDKVRKDAEDKERKEREEREAVDAARRRADAESHSVDEETRAQLADAQMRADRAYQAWGRQAPSALHAETLRDFKIRLLQPLKQHSKTYKDSALELVRDDAAFSVIENAIINDAVEASCTPPPAGAPLREVVTHTDSGHVVRKFIGDAGVCWAPFMGGTTRVGRINANRSRQ